MIRSIGKNLINLKINKCLRKLDMAKKQKGLNVSQKRKLNNLDIKPQLKGAMKRHASAKLRSVKHNNQMITEMKKGATVTKAHIRAVKKVGL